MPLILVLAGCHAFQTLEIPCVAGEPCASPDTGPTEPGVPVTGWIVSYDTPQDNAVVETHSPDGSLMDSWSVDDTSAGPVAWSPDEDYGVLIDGERVFGLSPGVAAEYLGETTNGIATIDVERVGDYLWFAVGDNLYASDGDVWFKVFDVDLDRAEHLAGDDGMLYLTAETGDGVDLYAIDPAAVTWSPVHRGLNAPRARNVFLGPEGGPYACSAAGAVYSLDALAAGNADTVAFYDGTVGDVRDCGYDPGDGRYLLFSPTLGVLKIDPRGRGEVLTEVPAGYAGMRANFFR